MNPLLKVFSLNVFYVNPQPGNFPVNACGDYSLIRAITKKQLLAWPAFHLQCYLDYCLAKEIYEIAAMIRDVAFVRRIRLRFPI